MSEEVSTGQPKSVLRTVLEGTTTVTVACTDERLLSATVTVIEEFGEDRPETVRLLVPERVAARVKDDFVTATTLVDLEESGDVSLRTVQSLPEPVVLTEDALFPLLEGIPSKIVAVRVDDAALRREYEDALDCQWEDGSSYALDTFAQSRFLDSLEGKFGPTFREDFERALAAPDTRGHDDTLDPVDLLVLLAAKHGVQSYELNRWGESFGVASVGKFSQSKRKLEEIGLVDTEKIHSGSVGRPRQRLVVGQEELSDAEPEQLVEAMRSVTG